MLSYTPNTVLIPKQILQHPAVCSTLLQAYNQVQKNPSTGEIYDVWRSAVDPKRVLNKIEKKEHLINSKVPYIYDVFLRKSVQNKYQLVVLAIKHKVVDDLISHPQIWCNGGKTKYQIIKMSCLEKGNILQIFVADCSSQMQKDNDQLKIELKWVNPIYSFSKNFLLRLNQWHDATPKLTLCTLQKNNPLEWIHDWILYHHSICNVERILIYDNFSEYKPKLEKYLSALETNNLEICLIHWNIDYAPQSLQWNQYGQINHAYYWLWDKISWVINFDIDEYLVNRTGQSLNRYLKRYTSIFCPSFNLGQQVMSPHTSNNKNTLPLVTDFKWIGKIIDSTKQKNIILGRQGLHKLLTQHYPIYCDPYNQIKTYFDEKQYKLQGKRYFIVKRLHARFLIFQNFLLNTVIKSKLKVFVYLLKPIIIHFCVRRPIQWGLYFNHYKGLKTLWKEEHLFEWQEIHSKTNTKKNKKDEFMLEALKKAKVGQYYSKNKNL